MIDRQKFFASIKPLFGKFSQSQVDGMNALLDEAEKRGVLNRQDLAYMLATAFHETARTMQPIAEYGKGKGRKYGKPGKHGQVAYGRGYVQLTWDYNYEKADAALKLKGALLKNYDLALRPDIAAAIMFRGMQEGWFTGKKLGDYINVKGTDYKNARRIINGTDKADTIAGYAVKFEKALKDGSIISTAKPVTYDQPVIIPAEPKPPPPDIPAPETAPDPAQAGFFMRVLRWLFG